MSQVTIPFRMQRVNRTPLDASERFDTLQAFETYLANGPAYSGQRCIVLNGANEPDVYRVLADGTYIPDGAGSQSTQEGIEEAPLDGEQYARQNGEWKPIATPQGIADSPEGAGGGGIEDVPDNGVIHGRKDGQWVELLPPDTVYIHGAAGGMIPDYANMESINRISTTTSATWTADRDGFVQVTFKGASVASMAWRPVCLINNKEMSRESFAGGGSAGTSMNAVRIHPVMKGDIVRLVSNDHDGFSTGTSPATNRDTMCYFIPPRFILAPQEFVIGVEYETGLTHPNGKKIYRMTYQIPSGTSVPASIGNFTLVSNFGVTKQLTGFDTRMTYVKLANGNSYAMNISNHTSMANNIQAQGDDLIFVRTASSATTVAEGYVTVMYYYK